MVTAVSHAAPAQSVAPAAKAPAKKPAPPPPPPAAASDTVQLSAAAQAALAAAKENTETPQQTAKEAMGGDLQAQRLQAREAAAAKAPSK